MYKFSNIEFMALLRLNAKQHLRVYSHCTRWEMEPGSSIYVHNRDGFTFYAATGQRAVTFCTELLGRHTKLNGHGHKTWYLYNTEVTVA